MSKKQIIRRRGLCGLLALAMCIGVMPPTAGAAQKGITGGMSDTLFAPNAACPRAQIATFLWRTAGSPEPKSTNHPFADVPSGSYYEKAVLWAVENGITEGTSDTTFAPGTICTRAQGAALLYRAAGSPAVSGSASFTDVPADAYYADAAACHNFFFFCKTLLTKHDRCAIVWIKEDDAVALTASQTIMANPPKGGDAKL